MKKQKSRVENTHLQKKKASKQNPHCSVVGKILTPLTGLLQRTVTHSINKPVLMGLSGRGLGDFLGVWWKVDPKTIAVVSRVTKNSSYNRGQKIPGKPI